jgi:uncharacterized protein YcbK (DUF882 family)
VLLASCTSAIDPPMSVGMTGFNASASDVGTASKPIVMAESSSQMTTTQQTAMTSEGDAPLPEQVAYVPMAKPEVPFPLNIPASAETIAVSTPEPLPQSAQTDAIAEKIAAADAAVTAPKPAAPATNNQVYVTASEAPQSPRADAPKKSFLASLFGTTPASAASAPLVNARTAEQPAAAQATAALPTAKPVITMASANSPQKPVQLASIGDTSHSVSIGDTSHSVSIGDTSHYTSDALPGVRQTALFEIKRKSGLDDESDVDLNEDEGSGGGSYQVASAAGMARLAPNGLMKQNESVDVACLKPSLVRVLKTIEGHYGRKMTVTSGYRDPARNRRANGAKNSLHMYCAAADIQVPGVSKWELASYIRSMPGRGGVGTYCHTESVHVDVGPERDWNWRCRRRSGGGDG